jgi:hypothetical protein
MPSSRLRSNAAVLIAGIGVVLFVAAVVHHATELLVLETAIGPVAALALDVPGAVGLIYAGYWLSKTDLSQSERWTVCVWCFSGVVLFVAVISATLLLRIVEGRVVSEPAFSMLIAAEAGGIAGFLAGYYNARAQASARRATAARNALAFVNELIRHDLRNDLNVIHGHAKLLADGQSIQRETADPDVIREKSTEALTRIETTRAVADTLLRDPGLERVDVVPLVADLAGQFDDAFAATVRTALPESAPVAANAGLRSVVDNLLENAVEHNDASDPQVTVSVTTHDESVVIRVSDNGPGLPEETASEFLTAHEEASATGGLSLVATLVSQYGGSVRHEDADTDGTTIAVKLPRADEDDPSTLSPAGPAAVDDQ